MPSSVCKLWSDLHFLQYIELISLRPAPPFTNVKFYLKLAESWLLGEFTIFYPSRKNYQFARVIKQTAVLA